MSTILYHISIHTTCNVSFSADSKRLSLEDLHHSSVRPSMWSYDVIQQRAADDVVPAAVPPSKVWAEITGGVKKSSKMWRETNLDEKLIKTLEKDEAPILIHMLLDIRFAHDTPWYV